MKSFNIPFQLLRKFCKGQLFGICHHPGNGQQGGVNSCCVNCCPVIGEAKQRKAAEEFNNDLTTKVKTPLEEPAAPDGEITPLCKSCKLLEGCPFGGKFKQGCYQYRPV